LNFRVERKQGIKIQKISLSTDAIRHRISDTSQDIPDQSAGEIRTGQAKINLQLNKSIHVSNYAQLLVYCRYMHAGEFKKLCKV